MRGASQRVHLLVQAPGAHQRHVISVTAAAEEEEAVRARCSRGVHPRARALAARLHALPFVGLHSSVQRPRISQRLRDKRGVAVSHVSACEERGAIQARRKARRKQRAARLVAVVTAEHKQEALANKRQHVRVPRARPLALHDLCTQGRAAPSARARRLGRRRSACTSGRSGTRERAPRGASGECWPDQARKDRRWPGQRDQCRPATEVWCSASQTGRCDKARERACTTTMLPTAAAACAARGEGASPSGASLVHAPERMSKQCTSEVAPASRMPVAAPAPADEFSSAVAPPNKISLREFSPRQAVSECPQRASGADALSSAGTRPTRE